MHLSRHPHAALSLFEENQDAEQEHAEEDRVEPTVDDEPSASPPPSVDNRSSELSRMFADDPTLSPVSYDQLTFSDFEDDFVTGPHVISEHQDDEDAATAGEPEEDAGETSVAQEAEDAPAGESIMPHVTVNQDEPAGRRL